MIDFFFCMLYGNVLLHISHSKWRLTWPSTLKNTGNDDKGCFHKLIPVLHVGVPVSKWGAVGDWGGVVLRAWNVMGKNAGLLRVRRGCISVPAHPASTLTPSLWAHRCSWISAGILSCSTILVCHCESSVVIKDRTCLFISNLLLYTEKTSGNQLCIACCCLSYFSGCLN